MAIARCDLESLHPPLAQELPRIVRRIQVVRPAAPVDDVEVVVALEARRLGRSRVHDFLPILVERAALAALDRCER